MVLVRLIARCQFTAYTDAHIYYGVSQDKNVQNTTTLREEMLDVDSTCSRLSVRIVK